MDVRERETEVQIYSSCKEGGGVGGGERETVGLVAGPPPLLVFLKVYTLNLQCFNSTGSPHQRFVIAQTLVSRFPAAAAIVVEAQELSESSV